MTRKYSRNEGISRLKSQQNDQYNELKIIHTRVHNQDFFQKTGKKEKRFQRGKKQSYAKIAKARTASESQKQP